MRWSKLRTASLLTISFLMIANSSLWVWHTVALSASSTPTLIPQLPSNLPAITATNAQKLSEIARLCAVATGDCFSAPIAWSPDSRRLAVGSTVGVDLFDVYHLSQAPKHIPTSARRYEQFSPDWSFLAVINMDWSVTVWNVETSEKKFTIPLPNLHIGFLRFSPNGQFLALFASDYSARLWDIKAGKQVSVWNNDWQIDPTFAFSPDGSTFAITTYPTAQSSLIQLWDMKTNQVFAELKIEDDLIISAITFSPDSSMLVMSSRRNTTVWNTRTMTKQFDLDMTFKFDWALASVFSPNGKVLAAFGRQRIYLWDVATQKQIGLIDGLGLDGVSVGFGADSTWLFSTDWSDSDFKPHVRLWNTASGLKLADFVNEQFPVLSPDGTLLATSELVGRRVVIIRAVR